MAAVEIPVHVVRVFTTADGSRGNPLGIVESTGETRGREQEIATRLGFSETVFIDGIDNSPSADSGPGVGSPAATAPTTTQRPAARIRIFTPAQELPFAGHPTVGTAWWLRERGHRMGVLAVPAGDVGVRYEGDLTWVTGRASWSPEFTWHELDYPNEVDDLDPAAYTSGHHYAYAWLNDAQAALDDPQAALDDQPPGLDDPHATPATPDAPRATLRSRMFAPQMGIAEDEATGSAAVRLTARLGRDLEIVQGGGSRLSTRRISEDLVDLGGRVVSDPDVSVNID